ncbi:MAG: hypothetical protein NVS4B7_12930 [Ktedonobacteraceae bacterium]
MHAKGRLLTLTLMACVTMLTSEVAQASGGPALSRTLAVGSYIVQVNLYQYPPITDQAVQVTVVPQESTLRLSGRINMLPGLGTNAVPLHAQLSPLNSTSTLIGNIRMPVRGAWQISVQLAGPQGTNEASFPIVVAGPGAMPIWLGWLIGSLPLLCLAWIIWQQQRYRRQLLIQNTA